MPVITNNDFASDTIGVQLERLKLIQENWLATRKLLDISLSLERWGELCYIDYILAVVSYNTERTTVAGESLAQKRDVNTKRLAELHQLWFDTMGKDDSRIESIGCVNPPDEEGLRLPSVPLSFVYVDDNIIWNPGPGTPPVGYQLITRTSGESDWEELWSGLSTSIAFTPSTSATERYFCVRARNSRGWGAFSDELIVRQPKNGFEKAEPNILS